MDGSSILKPVNADFTICPVPSGTCGDPHIVTFCGKEYDMKIEKEGYYNIIDDPFGK